jgi:tetratricopeptide (TPR) repeat protein
MRLWLTASLTWVAPATLAGQRAADVPPLPALTLDAYPPAARSALAEVDRAARARPHDATAVGSLARMLHAWEQWNAAHAAYARAQTLAPDTADWWYLDAVVLQRLGRAADAVPLLQRTIALKPASLPARLRLAESLFDAGDLAASRSAYEALVREPAAEPIAELGLGRLDALEGRTDAAITHLERAIALFPELGAAHYALARAYRSAGRLDAAAQSLAKHREFGTRWPAVPDAVLEAIAGLRNDARTDASRGLALADRGDLQGAITATEAALARDPSLVQARANLISLYGRTGQWEKAEASYRAVMATGLHKDEAHYNYGVLLSLQDRWSEAAEAYRAALAVNPLHAQAHNNLGQLLERDKALDAAEREYRAARAAQPAFRLAGFNLSRLLIAQGRAADAIVELEALRTPVDAETPRYLFALSVAYLRAGRRDDCIATATEARRLAAEYRQQELVEAIDRNLATLRGAR